MARMDVFNLWNHPIFRFPSTIQIATPATFGQITETAVPSRLIQFGLNLPDTEPPRAVWSI